MRSIITLLLSAALHISLACADDVAQETTSRGPALYVSNFGVDAGGCGARSRPCRSISKVLIHAPEYSTIWVGPGRYGDIHGDGDFDDVGDENVAFGCSLCISTRGLRFFSQEGPTATLIDLTGTPFSIAIHLFGRDVHFGAPGRGFHVLGGTVYGIYVENSAINARVRGNIASGGTQGVFRFPTEGVPVVITDNIAIATPDGYGFNGEHNVLEPGPGGRAEVRRNWSIGNQVGFGIGGLNVVFTDNVAESNHQGALIGGNGIIVRRNSITNSGREGVFLGGVFEAFTGNSVVGSRGPGVVVSVGSSIAVFSGNNIYGNGTSSIRFADEPRSNCGLYNASGTQLLATRNFWGSSAGPGADPADEICEARNGSSTVVEPVAVRPFKMERRPLVLQQLLRRKARGDDEQG